MRKLAGFVVFALVVVFSVPAMAADGAGLYKNSCAMCHGAGGEGAPGMGPALKGNKFVAGADDAALADVIIKGRMGAAKMYKDIPLPMMPMQMKPDEIKAVNEYVKGMK
jgi:mono/diheme cytochrome c family protein